MAKLYNVVAVDKYEVNGESKNKYINLGSIVETKSGKKMLMLDAVPVKDLPIYLNEPEERNRPLTQNEVLESSGDFVPKDTSEDIDLSQVPF